MKKQYYVILALLAFATTVQAQSYQLTVRTATYTELESPTLLSDDDPWDDDVWNISMPFDFQFFEESLDQIVIGDGYVYFTALGSDLIGIFSNDLRDAGITKSRSPVAYQVAGSSPDRIFKIQWKNAHFFEGDNRDSANFQLWLYEQHGKIEMHYGPSHVGRDSAYGGYFTSGAAVYMMDVSGSVFIGLTADPSEPDFEDNFQNYSGLNGHPENGIVYEFNYGWAAVVAHDLELVSNIRAYPVPMQESLNLELPGAGLKQVQILDAAGRIVAEKSTYDNNLEISVLNYKTGVYILNVTQSGQKHQFKLVK
ncbi:MAG: T9SS type A sorting domain-containing protein [Bacteroidia bacterium]